MKVYIEDNKMKVYIKKGENIDGKHIADQLGWEYDEDAEIDENTEVEELDVEFVFEEDNNDNK